MSEQDRLTFKTLPNRKIQITIIKNEMPTDFNFVSKDAAVLVGQVLHAAKDSFIETGNPLIDFTKSQTEWVSLYPSRLGLGSSHIPNHESFVIQFGDAILAIPIEKTKLRQLGEALVALSADSDSRH
jgi:hypothetical protein